MKKIVLVLIALSVVLSLAGCAYSVDDIKREYAALEERISNENVQTITSEKWALEGYSEIFGMIASSSNKNTEEYAALVREITKNTSEFDDEDVFDVAKSYSDLFDALANDEIELGINDLNVKYKQNGFAMVIEYAGSQYNYSVKKLTEDDPDYTGNSSLEYDGSMGKYRMLISISDIEATAKFREKHDFDKVYNLVTTIDAILKLKVVSPDTHSVYIVIGSDKPLSVTECNSKMLLPMGELQIDISVE
ncbi:MAG: hypothetical protein E7312_08960 [Clostridiales bacterium]|nr:hypothetical protein [Clostridiales bacterium]